MERSLILLKPDCLQAKVSGNVISRFESEGFQIASCKMIQLDDSVLREHYAHIVHLPNFPQIMAFMSSRPVLAMIVQGENVIKRIRELLGPTDSTKALPGTIRGDLGTNSMQNVLHASDGPDSADEEIARFFSPAEVFDLPT